MFTISGETHNLQMKQVYLLQHKTTEAPPFCTIQVLTCVLHSVLKNLKKYDITNVKGVLHHLLVSLLQNFLCINTKIPIL